MKRTSKLIRKFLVGATISLVVSIMFLEIGSQYYQCPDTGQNNADVLACHSSHYPVDPEQMQMIQALSEAQRQGTEASKKELDQIINLVKYEEMGGLNGVACGNGMLFVRDNLSEEAKYFVARHELEHAFRWKGVNLECSKEEYCATMIAAKIYPVGFIETILSSLYLSASESPTVWCFLFGSWRIFREYILGW
jgi:hypothetical protein